MERIAHAPLAPLTTIHVGGCAHELVICDSTEEFAREVSSCDAEGAPLFVLGGGSNVLIADDGFVGRVVHPRQARIELLNETSPDEEHDALVRCEAGVVWDDFVAFCVERDLAGVEGLSGIPGCIGSACMQNIGAYGQEMGTSLISVRMVDRANGCEVSMSASDLHLGYRTSILRTSMEEEQADGAIWGPSPRWIVLEATFGLKRASEARVENSQLVRALGVESGTLMPIKRIRTEVLNVRGQKAMLADVPATSAPDYDRWSTGSFFKNPVLSPEEQLYLPKDAPRYPQEREGYLKTSAAWLIEHAGFPKGYGVREGAAATLSQRHTLALTNRGQAKAADVFELAEAVMAGVKERFGIQLVPETVFVDAEHTHVSAGA